MAIHFLKLQMSNDIIFEFLVIESMHENAIMGNIVRHSIWPEPGTACQPTRQAISAHEALRHRGSSDRERARPQISSRGRAMDSGRTMGR